MASRLAHKVEADRLDGAGVDERLLLLGRDGGRELAVQVGRRGEVDLGEPARERREHRSGGVQVAMLLVPPVDAVLGRRRCAVGRALVEVPAGGVVVEAFPSVLVDDDPPAGAQQLRHLGDRAIEVMDVMERADGDEGIERLGVGEVLERNGLEDVALRGVRVDRGDGEAAVCEGSRQVAAAAPDLEDTGRPCWEVLLDEGLQVHHGKHPIRCAPRPFLSPTTLER